MRLLSVIGLLAIVIGIAALVFFFGGFFNVAATNPEPAPVKWALIKVRMASIDRHATDRPPSGYDTPAQVQAGAKAYMARGCTNCHGGPGVDCRNSPRGCGLTRPISPRSSRNASRAICSGL